MSDSKNKLTLTAVLFRNIFIGLFVLLFLVAILLSVFGIRQLQTTADDVQSVVAEANTIDSSNARTAILWGQLQENEQAVKRVRQVVAESKSYAYQDVIVRDLKSFAKKAGIVITNYDFTVGGDTSTASGAAPAPVEAPAAPAADSGAGPESPAAGELNGTETTASAAPAPQLKTTSVSVTVDTPVNYKKLLRFINYIEQNLTKMQISQVSLSRATNENQNDVTSDALTIEVYIR